MNPELNRGENYNECVEVPADVFLDMLRTLPADGEWYDLPNPTQLIGSANSAIDAAHWFEDFGVQTIYRQSDERALYKRSLEFAG